MNLSNRKTTLLLTLSAAFEYYDFVIYGLMANYLSILFFPDGDEFVKQLQVFAVFILSYMIRPLGGMVLGLLGDSIDRRSIFIKSNIILAIATIAISITPSYHKIGIIATIILVFLRIIQAFTFAGELAGSMSLLKDSVKTPSQSFSFVVSGAAIGAILASSVLYFIESVFSKEDILEYAWRIPFILGAFLCVIGMLMRKNLPIFHQEKLKSKFNFTNLFLPQRQNILAFITIISLPAYLIIMNMFFPSFLPKFYGYQSQDTYLAITISMIFAVIFAPFFSYYTNKIAKIRMLRTVIISAMILCLIIHYLLSQESLICLIIGLCLYQTIISSLMVLIFPLMAETFPSKAIFTLIAACYNIAYLLMSFAPIIITNLADQFNNSFVLWIGFILFAIIALANMSKIGQSKLG